MNKNKFHFQISKLNFFLIIKTIFHFNSQHQNSKSVAEFVWKICSVTFFLFAIGGEGGHFSNKNNSKKFFCRVFWKKPLFSIFFFFLLVIFEINEWRFFYQFSGVKGMKKYFYYKSQVVTRLLKTVVKLK